MKRIILLAAAFIGLQGSVLAQNTAKVNEVISAEQAFNRLVERKGIKDAFLTVADPEGIVFRPNVIKITDFYNSIDKQPGSLSWQPKFARISAAGDLAFSAGPYIYQNGKDDTDKVFGDYVSVWRADQEGKLKLLIDLGIQHPEPEKEEVPDFKEPDTSKHGGSAKDPFSNKAIIVNTDKIFNHELTVSVLASYKEFLSPEGRYYFPGFEPISGMDKIMQFLDNEGISINAKTLDAGRSISGDLAYTYGTARIRKGDIVSDYNYVRIWEIDASHKWNILLEVFSAVEQQ
jgi:ketosteroid isomerase-like protein